MVISVPESFGLSTQVVGAESLSWVYDISARLDTELAREYRKYITRTLESLERRRKNGDLSVPKLAALVLEPLVMGAGGMVFVDPLFQRVLVDVVRSAKTGLGLAPPAANDVSPSSGEWSGLPVIFDEVFVGLYRLGMESTGPLLGAAPDISVNAKILTGGLVPLAVTLASEAVFRAFLGNGKAAALLHGHSYTAHAIGCEVAGETLRVVDQLRESEGWKAAKRKWDVEGGKVWSFWDPGFIQSISKLEVVEEVMTLGCVLAVKLKDDGGGTFHFYVVGRDGEYSAAGYVSSRAQQVFGGLKEVNSNGRATAAPGGGEYNIHYRTLGDVGYFMTSLNTSGAVTRSVEDKIWRVLSSR